MVVTTPSSTATVAAVGSASTNGSGQAQFTVSDTKAESPVLTATATFASSQGACPSAWSAGTCTVKAATTVTFISPPTTLTATAAPATVPADGVSASQVTVTAMAGGTPVSGLEVELVPSGGPAASAVFTPANAVTGSNGQATIAVTDTVAGAVTLTPEYSDALSNTFLACQGTCTVGTGSVTFTETEGEASTITAATGGAPADGVARCA